MLKRAKHNLSHYVLQSFDMGQLVPVAVQEVLPGDTFRMSTNMLLRLAPLVTPVMHPVEVTVHHWFVPNRLTWKNWEKFITGGLNGEDNSVYPTIDAPASTGFPVGSLGDYLGIPTGVDDISVSALPFRAYDLICNHYYLDEQLDTMLTVSDADGTDTTTNTALQNVRWGKDYFTKARPEPQLGPDVYLPIGTSAPVVKTDSTSPQVLRNAATGALSGAINNLGAAGDGSSNFVPQPSGSPALHLDLKDTYEVDLTEAAGVTINQLRQSSAIQRFMERMNRSGARYDEYLLGLGVKSSDARLQLPEYLGGGSQIVQFSEILGTTGDNLGELGGHGIAAMRSNAFTRFFEEHGFLITLAFVRPKTMYTQGINRIWNRRTKYDFWQRELQHIGDQEVLKKEIFAQGTSADDDVFGFTPRYDEYRQTPSRIAGEMRTVLDSWHMARIFESAPALNSDFVKSNPTDRVFASSTNQTLYCYAKHSVLAQRLVAKHGTSFLA